LKASHPPCWVPHILSWVPHMPYIQYRTFSFIASLPHILFLQCYSFLAMTNSNYTALQAWIAFLFLIAMHYLSLSFTSFSQVRQASFLSGYSIFHLWIALWLHAKIKIRVLARNLEWIRTFPWAWCSFALKLYFRVSGCEKTRNEHDRKYI
jgi:hypothetical protein